MWQGADRRRAARRHYAHGRLPPAARIRPGTPVTVVDLSATGTLVESALRCKPGARCELVVTMGDGREQAVRAQVARCYVARLSASTVRYRTALAFEQPRPLPDETLLVTGYELPAGATRPAAERVAASRRPDADYQSVADVTTESVRSRDNSPWHRP